jgi:hypothetical protein
LRFGVWAIFIRPFKDDIFAAVFGKRVHVAVGIHSGESGSGFADASGKDGESNKSRKYKGKATHPGVHLRKPPAECLVG